MATVSNDEAILRDVLAGFAMCAMVMRGGADAPHFVAEKSYVLADVMMEARKPKDEDGIRAIKTK